MRVKDSGGRPAWLSGERWRRPGKLPLLGITGAPLYAQVYTAVAVVVFVAAVVVGLRVSDARFSQAVPWSQETPSGGPAIARYRLSTVVVGEGRVLTSVPGTRFAEGQELVLTAQPLRGATFVGWSGDVEGTESSLTLTMDADTRVVATFERDTTPPQLDTPSVTAGSAAAVVRWTSDDASTSRVTVRTDGGSEVGTFERANMTRDHSVTITGLDSGTTYTYEVASANRAGAVGTAPATSFTTPADSEPLIDVFGGPNQVVGEHGQPQTAYGLLGNVSDPDGLESLSYTLNGGEARALTIGPDSRRVWGPGDFNADIAFADLEPGLNEVVIRATDGAGAVATSSVTLDYRPGTPRIPYATDWAGATRISDWAQVVDGRWALDGDTVRPLELGYDRLLMVGDVSWHDYEVTVPVTVHGLGAGNGAPNSGSSLVGLALNWNGHTQVADEQPPRFYYPTGALGWYRWYEAGPQWELRGNEDEPIVRHRRIALEFGRAYVFKARSETVAGGVEYSWKVWPQGSPEPVAWDLTVVEPAGPATGSVGVIAHHVDAQFGNISVVPITEETPGP